MVVTMSEFNAARITNKPDTRQSLIIELKKASEGTLIMPGFMETDYAKDWFSINRNHDGGNNNVT